MLNLKDKIAVVSGCGSLGSGFGNGRAISTILARQGAKVFGTDINEEAGQNTSNFIKEEGNDFTFNKVNMTNEEEVQEFFIKIEKSFLKLFKKVWKFFEIKNSKLSEIFFVTLSISNISSFVNFSTIPLPKPEAPPVIIAVLLSKRIKHP